MTGPTDPERDPAGVPRPEGGDPADDEAMRPPRRSRQPYLTVLALLGVLLLVLAVGIFGGFL